VVYNFPFNGQGEPIAHLSPTHDSHYLITEGLGSFEATLGENGETGVINGEYLHVAIVGQSQGGDFIQPNNCVALAGG
jgi:hypothetical protein